MEFSDYNYSKKNEDLFSNKNSDYNGNHINEDVKKST
jgi:hypothetical protein